MPWMRISFAEKAFVRLLAERGLSVATLTVEEGITAMLDFYAEFRAQHTAGGGEDVITVSWSSEPIEEFSIGRRMLRGGAVQLGAQLTLRFSFDAAPWRTSGSASYTDPEIVRALEATHLARTAQLASARLEFVSI